MEIGRTQPTRLRWLVPAAIAISAAWLFVLYFYLSRDFDRLFKLTPNEFGDFLAGAFAPLAFFWLIVAVLLQKQELQAQREELELNRQVLQLQADELRNSVTQLKTQAQILEKQFQASGKQKALIDIQDGIHGICSIIIGKFASQSSGTSSSSGKLVVDSWIALADLYELLENKSYTFLIAEIARRIRQRTASLTEQVPKHPAVYIKKKPSFSELDRIATHIRRVFAIPKNEGAPELEAKFELEYPLDELLQQIAEVRNLCVEHRLTT